MRSTLLSAAAAAALTVMALPALAQAQSVAAKTPCEITDPVAHGAARAEAQANIIADRPDCAPAPLSPVGAATDTSAVVSETPAYTSATVAETSPPVATPTTYEPQAASVTNQLVTNGPVADTPENRAKYGAPMSRAGKMTKPIGN